MFLLPLEDEFLALVRERLVLEVMYGHPEMKSSVYRTSAASPVAQMLGRIPFFTVGTGT